MIVPRERISNGVSSVVSRVEICFSGPAQVRNLLLTTFVYRNAPGHSLMNGFLKRFIQLVFDVWTDLKSVSHGLRRFDAWGR